MPLQRPLHVLAHQRRRMVGARIQRRHDGRVAAPGVGRIAEADGEVAQPALVADAADGAAFGLAQKGGLVPRKQDKRERGIFSRLIHRIFGGSHD